MSQSRVSLGKLGEDLACRELERRGYAIVARRYRTRYGEIDIVAHEGEVIVFVEVRARSSEVCGGPFDSVTGQKRAKLVRMARDYLARRARGQPACRFDVVGVTRDRAGRLCAEVIQNAFTLDQ
jgi:putative endonuclease